MTKIPPLSPVESSNVKAVGFDGKDLYVQFHGQDRIYKYADVSPQRVRAFLRAPSKGKYLNSRIKGNYKYERIS